MRSASSEPLRISMPPSLPSFLACLLRAAVARVRLVRAYLVAIMERYRCVSSRSMTHTTARASKRRVCERRLYARLQVCVWL